MKHGSEQDTLEKTVRRSLWIALAVAATVLLAYLARYALDSAGCPRTAADAWGQFGDYVGGVLNPVIASLALYWLTQSVVIQRKELSETKTALAETAASQTKQARHAEGTVRIGALGAELSSIAGDIQYLREVVVEARSDLRTKGSHDTPNGPVVGSQLKSYIEQKRVELEGLLEARQKLRAQLVETIELGLKA